MPARVPDQPRYRGMNSLAVLVQEAFKRDRTPGILLAGDWSSYLRQKREKQRQS
jgi:hypothetical protein